MTQVVVRRASVGDARAIATIRVETWRAAYAGLIAAEVLDRFDIDREAQRRATHWEERHVDPQSVELIAEVGGEPVGWAAAGPSRDGETDGWGEVYAIYTLPAHWSTGVGHALMTAAEDFLRRAGFRRAHLWYLDGNERAASFYQRHGWVDDGATKLDDRLVADARAAALLERRRVRDLVDS
ncbi:GNAT family N-acetyltransferase [Microbacterium sp. BK668]|uniref:GNAT family N-acetyltransferase n=1 Tax=Microbacterium sp. BK668 TaxID=2512118 RepID=UPI00105D912A|nr:GNAT family N-acetyltransferase [Microbacterium sp. BK668]TDN92010.1 ribosomal protein S18 acetylase RimI-like enzyme [Microbacterium sp. BK668]